MLWILLFCCAESSVDGPMGLRTIWYTCYTLSMFFTLAAISQVPSGVSGTVGLQVTMFKMDQGTRVVGSSVRVKSEIRKTAESGNSVQVQLYATLKDQSEEAVASPVYYWQEPSDDASITTNFGHLNLSSSYSEDLTRTIEWLFSDLPLEYDHLFLETKAYITEEVTEVSGNTTLYVSSCPSLQTVPTVNQSSSFNITANSVGHYNKPADCSCLHDDEVLFDIAGNRAIGTATCAVNAKWVGCENLQCWSGPQNVTVTQVNMRANAVGPFKCSSDGGFPNPEREIFKLNGKPIPDDYQLKSSDHGKNLSCQVVSPYTKKQLEKFESSPKEVVVYYKPENSTVSDDPAVIPMNSSKLLTYSVYANAGVLTLMFLMNQDQKLHLIFFLVSAITRMMSIMFLNSTLLLDPIMTMGNTRCVRLRMILMGRTVPIFQYVMLQYQLLNLMM